MKRTWLVAFSALALLVVPVSRGVAGEITFDQLVDGGQVFYNGGALGANVLSGEMIQFDIITGNLTPLNSGVALACIGCVLNFDTGVSTDVTGPVFEWAGGGFYTVTGAVPALGIAAGSTLVTGTWLAPVVGVINGSGTQILVTGFGLDTKHPDLAAFYGLGPDNWEFGHLSTTSQLMPQPGGEVGSFFGPVTEADLVNTPTGAIPEPGVVGLLGLGLTTLGVWARRKRMGGDSK